MQNSERDRFDGRLKTASQAKQKQLERFKAAAVDPEKTAKRTQLRTEAADREAQRKAKAALLLREKESLELQDAENRKNKRLKIEAGGENSKAQRPKAGAQEMTQEAAREAERKAERDRRYAARRNRKR